MNADDAESRFALALTQSSLGKIPPELHVATGHHDEVMLFIIRVGDARATTDTLMEVIALSEVELILSGLKGVEEGPVKSPALVR